MKRWIRNAFFAVSILFLVFFLLIAYLSASQQVPFNNEEPYLLEEWTLWQEDGSATPVSLPARVPVEEGAWLRLERDIPQDLPGPLVLCLRSSQQKVRILFEGEEIYTFGMDQSAIPFGNSSGSAWNLVRLPEDAGGGQVVIELCSPYPVYSGTIGEVRVGTKAALLFWLAETELPALVLTLLIFLIGVGLILGNLFLFRRHGVGWSALYLGLFSLLVSLWLLGETRMIQFFTGNVFANMLVAFLSMLLFPVPLLLYVGETKDFHFRKVLRGTALGLYLLTLVVCLMELLGSADLIALLPIFRVMLLLIGLLLLILVMVEWLHWHNSQARILFLSMLLICVFGVLEVGYLYASGGRNTGAFMRIGVLAFIAIQAFTALQRATQIVRLSKEATIDGLTGCLNRTAYRQQLPQMQAPGYAAVMADLNDLKFINDTFGHEAGDEALIRCSRCFLDVYRVHGDCFRLGGDEFLFLGKVTDTNLLARLTTDFRRALHRAAEDAPYALDIAVGWAVFDPDKDSALSDTIRRADQAMYTNKRAMK